MIVDQSHIIDRHSSDSRNNGGKTSSVSAGLFLFYVHYWNRLAWSYFADIDDHVKAIGIVAC